jgi:hypothetical protein
VLSIAVGPSTVTMKYWYSGCGKAVRMIAAAVFVSVLSPLVVPPSTLRTSLTRYARGIANAATTIQNAMTRKRNRMIARAGDPSTEASVVG